MGSGATLALLAIACAAPALAQAHNPFSVGISEGGGGTSGPMGWILAQQGAFERSIAAAVRASKANGSALWFLMGLSFLYGVLHAAGPGHGKAVLASYMVANRRALRRGIVLSFLAALLQAAVAILLVGLLSLLFHATAIGMRNAAGLVEKLSYVGVALLGAWMVWRKGLAFLQAWTHARAGAKRAFAAPVRLAPASMAYAGLTERRADGAGPRLGGKRAGTVATTSGVATSAFMCEAAHEHGPGCGHYHAPDPSTLGEGFSWREAASTVAAAGARPCSGAILVLVFGLAQGMFLAGVASTIVMALGTALTTAALASVAVLMKSVALRMAGEESGPGLLIGRGLELLAALLVLAVGLSLLLGVGPFQGLG